MYGILLAEGGGTLRRGAETIFGKSDAKLDDIWVQAIANDIWVLEQMVKAGDVMTRLLNNICRSEPVVEKVARRQNDNVGQYLPAGCRDLQRASS